MRILWTLIAVFMIAAPAKAQDLLAVDLASDHIDITTGFNGSELVLFGVQEQKGEIAIVFTGPRRDTVVRRKEQVGGIWLNRRGVEFDKVPSYYDYAVSHEEENIALPEVLKEQGIGASSLTFHPEDKMDMTDLREFQQALVRNRQAQGLFHTTPEKITFLNDYFFRTTFYIPPNVPTGKYQIKTFLFRNGKVADEKTLEVRVAQVGKSADIYMFAYKHSMIYGLICVAMAMSIGWFSSLIRRGP